MFLVFLILSLSFIIHYKKHQETQVSLDLQRQHYPSVNCLSNSITDRHLRQATLRTLLYLFN